MQRTAREDIRSIERIFEKGLQDDYLSRAIGKIAEHERERTSQEVQGLKNELRRFENTYQMSSAAFLEQFENGVLGDTEDYFEWSALFQMYARSAKRLEMLESVVD